MAPGLRNIPLRRYRKFLTDAGCECVSTKGGHEHWTRADLNRPITLQSHIDPVPEFIVRQHLRYLGMDREAFERYWER